MKFKEQFLLALSVKLNFLLLWRLNLKNFEITERGDNLHASKKSNRKLLSWTSAAIALLVSACGRETRSTTEVPLADETTNTPTAFDDKLVGSDDLDTFTALAGDDEIYGFGGNDQIIAGTGNDTIYGAMETIISNREQATIRYMAKEEVTLYLSAGADIEDGDGIDTIIFGPDQTTLPVTINLDTGHII